MFIKSLIIVLFIFGVLLAEEQSEVYPISISVLGDSISTAFQTGRVPFRSAKSHSWATGYDSEDIVLSHFEMLVDLNEGKTVTATNFAKVNKSSYDLNRQVNLMLAHRPEYILIMMGNNDLCVNNYMDMTDPYDYFLNMRNALIKITQELPSSKILLISHVRHDQLIAVGEEAGCSSRRRLFRMCLLMDKPGLNIELYHAYSNLYDQVLQSLAEEFAPNVRYSGVLRRSSFAPEHLSTTDCFHPSLMGQAGIAEAIWEDGFWGDIPMSTVRSKLKGLEIESK